MPVQYDLAPPRPVEISTSMVFTPARSSAEAPNMPMVVLESVALAYGYVSDPVGALSSMVRLITSVPTVDGTLILPVPVNVLKKHRYLFPTMCT